MRRRMHESVSNDYGRVAPNADGTKLCFSSDRSGQNAAYVLELASGRVTLVSDAAFWSFGPTWSSRDLIAFFSKKGGNALNIRTAHRPDRSLISPAKAASPGGRRTAVRSHYRPIMG